VTVSVDTNLLVYAVDAKAGLRHDRAENLIDRVVESGRGVLILQTLAEFYSVAVRKLGTNPATARGLVNDLRAVLKVHAADESALDRAMIGVEGHRLSFWDAMLWATAEQAGVRYMLTEDFQDRRRLGGVTFINPFNSANTDLLERELPPAS
jgi:predicted nucleic acid-binding protein